MVQRALNFIFTISILFFLNINIFGQQTPHHTQYLYNTQLFNPAYVGSKDYLSLTISSRLQWTEIEGAPATHTIASHKNLKKWPVGVGASFTLDRLGPVDQKNYSLDASYTIRPTENTKLAFGLKIGGETLTIALNKGTADEPGDPLLAKSIESKFSPTLAAGAYWYGKNWYLGLSTLNLLHANHFDGAVTDRPHYFIMGGYVVEINRELKFKPAILTKVVSGAPVSINASANFLFNESFSFGLTYNNGQSLSAVISADLSSIFTVGYSFDYSLKSLNQFSGGSHEVILSYRFTKSSKKHSCHTRFF